MLFRSKFLLFARSKTDGVQYSIDLSPRSLLFKLAHFHSSAIAPTDTVPSPLILASTQNLIDNSKPITPGPAFPYDTTFLAILEGQPQKHQSILCSISRLSSNERQHGEGGQVVS